MARHVVDDEAMPVRSPRASLSEPGRPAGAAVAMPSAAIMQEAAEWFARLRSLQGQRDHGAAWRQWLERDAEHRRAWQAIEAVCARLAPLEPGVAPERALMAGTLDALGRRRGQRRRLLGAVGGAVVLGGLGAVIADPAHLPALARNWRADERTRVGEQRELSLDPDTRLWLNTATRLNRGRPSGSVDLTPTDLELLEGEIFVAMDRARPTPLTVVIPQGRLAVSSGHFGIRVFADHTRIAVHEGQVGIHDPRTSRIQVVAARREVDLGPGSTGADRPLAVGRDAWTRGLILAADISLGEVIAELSRYSRRRITISPDAADLRVFGGFPVNLPDRTLAMLGEALPIRVRRAWPWETRIERA